jgi:leucyl-tRNA synthetase
MPTGLLVKHPLTGEQIPVWVGNYVLMGYGDGAVMGVPAHDERDFAFALKYQLPIKQVVHVDGEHFDYHRWQDWYADKAQRHHHQQRQLQRPAVQAPRWTPSPRRCRPRAWARRRPPGGCATGASAASATGARRSPSSIATLRLGAGAREGPARGAARRPGARRQRQPAEQVRVLPERGLPAVRQARAARDRHHGHLRRQRLVLHALHLPRQRRAMVDARNDYWMPMDQYIGGIEHAVLHLLYARFWTKAMRDLGLVKFGEPFTRLFTQGMLLNECFYREDDSRQEALVLPGEVDISFDDKGHPVGATGQGRRPAGDAGRHREDVQEQEQRGRAARHHRQVRRRHRARVHDVRRPARPERGLVRQRRRRRVPLPAPAVGLRREAAAPRIAAAPPASTVPAAPPPTCGASCTCCCARSATTTTACNTTPWCRAR